MPSSASTTLGATTFWSVSTPFAEAQCCLDCAILWRPSSFSVALHKQTVGGLQCVLMRLINKKLCKTSGALHSSRQQLCKMYCHLAAMPQQWYCGTRKLRYQHCKQQRTSWPSSATPHANTAASIGGLRTYAGRLRVSDPTQVCVAALRELCAPEVSDSDPSASCMFVMTLSVESGVRAMS